MKPDINEALLNAAQEIIGRFSPLIEDEYERSRLGSWGALILISAMKFNDAGSALYKENEDIVIWLRDYTCLLYTSPSPRDATLSRMPSSA